MLVEAVGDVRRELGAGLMEGVYCEALGVELEGRGIPFERAPGFPIRYRGRELRRRYFPDFVVARTVILEAKAVETLPPVAFAQLLTYLRLSGAPLGFLVNFNAVPLREGIHRRVNTIPRQADP